MTANRRARHTRGLTLIELMIALAVVGLLSAIAMPNYQNHLQRAHRNNAKAALVRVSQFMERAATANGMYPNANLVPAGVLVVEGGRYTLALASTNGAAYTATATRATGTPQASDACGDFRIDQVGTRSILNASTGKTAADCWGR